MIISYQLLLFCLTPVFIWLSVKHVLNNKDQFYLWQRLAIKLPAIDRPVWFHCASVGEVITAIPLISLYNEKFPDKKILITTNTITGANVCRKRLPFVTHCFLPLDYRFITRLFLKKIKPERLIILETELWPNLFQLCHLKNIPVTIINGRLSQRSLNINSWSKRVYKKTLAYVDKIYSRSNEDATAYKTLGAKDKQVEITGNLKFAINLELTPAKNLINRPYVLA
ncbi:MAG: 3-deoxy-D-manno-octulosonic acid transferase, partial [Gammaproteobacteria bacterium]|nr:3-deoxy-D-manno-octulosonic acid transferase [Gammaproteobacteria bacterium]